jgi:hypothetical protein
MPTVCESLFVVLGGSNESIFLVNEGANFVAQVRQDSDEPETAWQWEKHWNVPGLRGEFSLVAGVRGVYYITPEGIAFRIIDDSGNRKCTELIEMFASVMSRDAAKVEELNRSGIENVFQLPGDVVPSNKEPPLRATSEGIGLTPTVPGPGTDIRGPGVPYTEPPPIQYPAPTKKGSALPWLIGGAVVMLVGAGIYALWRE